jgi:hypothetical protein
MSTTVSLTHQLAEFEKGNIINSEGKSNTYYNFYDWFCADTSLQRKSIKLYRAVKKFVKYANIDTSKYYVFFKNNCPANGPLYDDFRICDRQTGDVIWNVTPKSGHSFKAEIYGISNGFKVPIAEGDTLSQIYKSGVKI